MKVLDIALKDLRRSFLSAFLLVFGLVLPLLTAALFFFAFGGLAGGDEGSFDLPVTRVLVVNLDEAQMGISVGGTAVSVGGIGVSVAVAAGSGGSGGVSFCEEAQAERVRARIRSRKAILFICLSFYDRLLINRLYRIKRRGRERRAVLYRWGSVRIAFDDFDRPGDAVFCADAFAEGCGA